MCILSGGGAPIAPVSIKKHFSRKSIHINIIMDETFVMMKGDTGGDEGQI